MMTTDYKPKAGDTGTFYPAQYANSAQAPARGKITRTWTDTCVNVECDNGLLPTSVLVVDPEKKPENLTGYYFVPDALVHQVAACQGTNCGTTVGCHSRECIIETGKVQGWTPTAEELAATKNPVREVYFFPDFLDFGRMQINSRGGALVKGMPWSFEINGRAVTHESDTCYIIADGSPHGLKFRKGEMLIFNLEDGSVSVEPVVPDQQDGPATLAEDFAAVVNRHSAENASGTPDYILGQYLADCLETWNKTRQALNKHYGDGKASPLIPRTRAG